MPKVKEVLKMGSSQGWQRETTLLSHGKEFLVSMDTACTSQPLMGTGRPQFPSFLSHATPLSLSSLGNTQNHAYKVFSWETVILGEFFTCYCGGLEWIPGRRSPAARSVKGSGTWHPHILQIFLCTGPCLHIVVSTLKACVGFGIGSILTWIASLRSSL